MRCFNPPAISVTRSEDDKADLITIVYRINDPDVLPRLTSRETMWHLGGLPGYINLKTLGFDPSGKGRTIKLVGGVYETITKAEQKLLYERRIEELCRLHPFEPTTNEHIEALGLEIPPPDADWVWKKVKKETT